MTSGFSPLILSRRSFSASRVRLRREQSQSAAESLPARNCTKLPSEPGAICANAVACRRSLMRIRIHDVHPRAMQAHVGANLPRQQRMLVGRIVADQQDRRSFADLAHRCRGILFTCQRRRESREVRRAMVVDVVGPQHQPRELLQQVVLFVRWCDSSR